VHLSSATGNWDFENDVFETWYKDQILIANESVKQSKKEHFIPCTFFFEKQEQKKYKHLIRKIRHRNPNYLLDAGVTKNSTLNTKE
jgi:predicted acetyltransferase